MKRSKTTHQRTVAEKVCTSVRTAYNCACEDNMRTIFSKFWRNPLSNPFSPQHAHLSLFTTKSDTPCQHCAVIALGQSWRYCTGLSYCHVLTPLLLLTSSSSQLLMINGILKERCRAVMHPVHPNCSKLVVRDSCVQHNIGRHWVGPMQHRACSLIFAT